MEEIDFLAYDDFSIKGAEIEEYVLNNFRGLNDKIIRIFNLEYYLASKHLVLLELALPVKTVYTDLLFTAFVKNMFSIYSAIILTQKGLVGSARLNMRYVFEFLMICKYVAISNNLTTINNWYNGLEIKMTQDILNKIKFPDKKEMKNLWKVLCQFTHCTIYSQQLEIDSDNKKNEIHLNFVFLSMLLEMNFHLLNSYLISKSLKYYVGTVDKVKKMNSLRKEIKEIFGGLKRVMSKEAKKVIYTYKLKWRV